MIEGTCDERFARVRDAFGSNFSEHAEIGAAVAVYAGGRLVVDLLGAASAMLHALDLGTNAHWSMCSRSAKASRH